MKENTLVDFLRHGEPVGGRRYRGQLDDPLSARGWTQMWHAVSLETPWSRIISSPLRRCSEFAAALAQRLDRPLTIEADFREIGFGEWEGQSAEMLKRSDPEIIRRYYHDPLANRPAGAEPLEAFLRRIGGAYDELVARHPGEHLLVIAHAGVIRGIISRVLRTPPEASFWINVDSAHFSRIRISRERPPTLMFHGRERLSA
jgi:alpha-ribazole phosphatase